LGIDHTRNLSCTEFGGHVNICRGDDSNGDNGDDHGSGNAETVLVGTYFDVNCIDRVVVNGK
jgi:hypothetical protein